MKLTNKCLQKVQTWGQKVSRASTDQGEHIFHPTELTIRFMGPHSYRSAWTTYENKLTTEVLVLSPCNSLSSYAEACRDKDQKAHKASCTLMCVNMPYSNLFRFCSTHSPNCGLIIHNCPCGTTAQCNSALHMDQSI